MVRAGRSVSHCKEIFTISEFSKRDIMETYHCDGEKISVIPCAWQHFLRIEEDAAIIEKLGLGKKLFFFSLGSRYYHKNFKWIAEAAKQNPQYDFVVAGTRKLNTSDRELENSGLDNLIFTGYIKDEEIKALMKACRAFIQPSLYEGFGLPVLEAFRAGCPVCLSDASCFPEVAGDAALYFTPGDSESVCDAVFKCLDNKYLCAKLVERGRKRLEMFDWKSSAAALEKVYRSLL